MKEKYKSRTFILTIWAIAIISIFGLLSLIFRFEANWITALFTTLGSAVAVYIGGEKLIDSKKHFE